MLAAVPGLSAAAPEEAVAVPDISVAVPEGAAVEAGCAAMVILFLRSWRPLAWLSGFALKASGTYTGLGCIYSLLGISLLRGGHICIIGCDAWRIGGPTKVGVGMGVGRATCA